MSLPANTVSIHPYFKVHPGKLEAAKALLPAFIEKSTAEEKSLCYDFTINGDEIFCREAYVGAEGALTHLSNVGALLGEMLKLADLTRLEIHGAAEELAALKAPLAEFKPAWFIRECGVA
jgi:quinol monooxygenase YgiN